MPETRARALADFSDNAAGLETVTVSDITDLTASAAELNKMDGVTASTAELNKLTGVTADTNELNLLDGVTATTTELNYVDGVSSALQTQINAKAPTASPTFTGNVIYPAISKASYTSSDASANTHGTGSGVIRQVQTNQRRGHVQNNNNSFDGTNSGTGMAVCIDNILAGSDILVTASFGWYISSGNVAYFTFFKRIDTGSGFNTEAQVGVENATYGISGGLQNASSNPDGKTHIATITWLESNCSAGRYQFELHRRSDSSSGYVGINARGESNGEVGTATIWAMELT